MKKTYQIEVDCANCANLMENAAKKTDGVRNAVVNFMTQKMIVEFEQKAEKDARPDRPCGGPGSDTGPAPHPGVAQAGPVSAHLSGDRIRHSEEGRQGDLEPAGL